MNPAWSVILFTTAAGAGYGLLVIVALYSLSGDAAAQGPLALVALALAGLLVTGGLLSSTFHLGHPERAWRALTQWRSAWLSREGVLALLCYMPALVWAAGLARGTAPGPGWPLATAALALATVHATSMIYASLKTVDAWHRGGVPLNYQLLALASGAVAWLALRQWHGIADARDAAVTIGVVVAAAIAKHRYWRRIDRAVPTSSLATATGLGGHGTVSVLFWPHTEDNYLLKEMRYVIARRHAAKLRRMASVLAFIVPAGAALASVALGDAVGSLLLGLALPSLVAGLVVERWLFFAEAKHVVANYYGR
ncbi:MAG: dimethyl sulfoxide reductase anchor subunit [Gammaproteobacteria bacterium]|nr:dimethyl sulfoxide reductase anchor subunit [Gammaproteobacteria bacterium]